jgi:hypothetical protein
MALKALQIFDAHHLQNIDIAGITQAAMLLLRDTLHRIQMYVPYVTDNGGSHINTKPYEYSSEWYVLCRHLGGYLTGTYKSDITDRGSSSREMVYILAPVVVLGVGITWVSQFNADTTWNDANASTRTWNQIFDIEAAPIVEIDLLYGDTSPPTNRIKKMEILSAIVTAQYYQVEITITDPTQNIRALVKNYSMKFCS